MEQSETINRETMKIVATKPTTSFEYLSKNLIKYLPNVPQIVLELALSALGSFSRTWFERSPWEQPVGGAKVEGLPVVGAERP